MEKKVYLVTYQSFSDLNGFDCAHAVDFQRDGEVRVFSSKEDANEWLLKMVEASRISGWFISTDNNDFIEMKHVGYRWRIYCKVIEKTLY